MEWNEEAVKSDLIATFGEDYAEEIEDSLRLDEGRYSDWGEAGSVTVDGIEYNIIKDEDEAERIATEHVTQDLEQEPSIFNQEWLSSHIDIQQAQHVFIDIYNEWNSSYAEDIKTESSKRYTNRLAEEMVDMGIITEEEGENEEFDLDNKIDDFVEVMTESQIDEGDGGLEHYRLNFGDEEANKVITEHQLIDINAAAEDAIDVDGWPHFISLYDGNYETTKNGIVYFRES